MRSDPVDWLTSRAILVGVSIYRDRRFLGLPAAANSIKQLRAVLTDLKLCGWPADRVTVLANPSDSRAVTTRIRKLAQETSGVLLLYYVGHGTVTPGGELCLTVADTDAAAPDLTGVEYERIRSAFRDSPARVKAAILDCCYSGRAIETLADQASVVADCTDIRGAYTLTASDLAAHVPPFEEQKISCTSFTGELVDLIRTGIAGQDESLTLGTLYLELRRRLRARGLPDPNQRGTDTAHGFSFTRNAALPDYQLGAISDRAEQKPRSAYSTATSPVLSRPRYRKPLLAAGLLATLAATATILALNTESQGSQPYSSARPGCDENNTGGQWRVTGGEIASCTENGSSVVKLADAVGGDLSKSNGELRFTPTGQPLPSAYQIEVTITGLSDPDPASQGACAGFATHTNEAGTTFEELAVCSNQYGYGKASLIKVSNGVEISRDELKQLQSTDYFRLKANVSATAVTFTIADYHGATIGTLSAPSVSSTTRYVGLTIFWMSGTATATFSDFNYYPQPSE